MASVREVWIPRVKLSPPRAQASQIGRADLLGPLATWRDTKLILIHAPAGFGKTVLLSQIYSEVGATHCARAWMSLSEDERSTEALLALLWKALQPILGEVSPDPAPVPQIPANHQESLLLDRVLRDLDAIDRDVWIFIDDLQFADAPASTLALRKLLRVTGQNVRFVFASRLMFDLGGTHLRAEGRAREITSRELRFSRANIAGFLEGALQAAELDQVLADTGGWPVAVRLLKSCLEAGGASYAALLAQGRPQREMFEYLSEQMLAGVSAPVEEFLLTTGICERINLELATAMSGGSDVSAVFETVLRMHLPLEPCADRPNWYQYHSLFAEFLRAAAIQRMPQKMKSAHVAAGRWFAARQSWAEALHHAFHGGTLGDALAALENAGGVRMAMRYGHRTLRPLANLERHLTRDFPLCRLGQIYYWTLEGQVAGARAALEDLRKDMRLPGTTDHPAGLDLLVIDLLVAVYEERPLSLQDIERLEQALKSAPEESASLVVAGQGMVIVGHFHTFQFDRCRAAIATTLLAYRSIQSPYSETFLHVYAVLVELEQGRLKDAREGVAALTSHIRERLGPQEPLRHLPDLLSAELSYESADFESAIEQLERARAGFGTIQGWFDLQIQLLRAASLILLRTRGLEAAVALIEDADARTIALGQRKAATACALHRANLLLRAGEWPAARAVIEGERVSAMLRTPLDRLQSTAYIRVYAGELRAEMDLIDEQPAEAEQGLQVLVAFARETGWSAALARLALLEAAALEQLGASDKAARLAFEGLDIARRAGLRSCIADRAELIAAPIDRLLATGHLLLDKLTLDYWRSIVGGAESVEDSTLARERLRLRLSPRQMQVLELLAHGCSSKEIADRLGLGLGTVKAHRISLYRKLGVRQRSGAVAAFEQLQGQRT